jgi:hypothetical protein
MPLRKLTLKQTEQIRKALNNGMSVTAVVHYYKISATHAYRIKNNEQRNRRKNTTMEKYNGWTNYATWLFYLHHSEDIYNWWHEHSEHDRQNHALEHIKEYFEEMYGELIDGIANTYLTDVILGELRDVDWRDILKTVTEDNNTTDANWTEDNALTMYLDHVAENKEKERN